MIRFLNIFKSKDQHVSPPVEPTFGRERVVTRSRQTSSSVDASVEVDATEDPERQRARHRLLGAALMVLVAIVGLPKVFDSEPKKVSNDVVLQMVASVVDPSKDSKADTQKDLTKKQDSEIAKESTKEISKESTKEELAKVEESKVTSDLNKDVKSAAKTNDKALGQGEEVVEDVTKPKKEKSATAKYTVNIGSFPSADRAKKWGAKLKEQKIPYFTQERKKDDETVFMLRAGPFSEKAEAEAAEKKIRTMGLNPKIVESK